MCKYIAPFVVELLTVVVVKINKVVVGSGHGNVPKYTGRLWHCAEHQALWVYCCHGALVIYSHFRQFLGGHASDVAHPKRVILFANVTSLNSAVTSYVTSQHCTCIGHVTFYYKRATDTSVGALACCLSICQVRLYHQRPTCGWCLTCVGHDVSSTSLG